jgi:hypothetical protein
MTRSRDIADTQKNLGGAVPPITAGKNAIINGAMDIWQRGTSVAVASTVFGYTADRWLTNQQSAITVSRQATGDTTNLPNIQYCARYQRNSGQTSTTVVQLTQPFESINSIPFAGKTVILSWYARAGANFSAASNVLRGQVYTGTGTDQNLLGSYTGGAISVDSTVVLTTTWQRFTATGTIPATATEIAPYFFYTPTGTAGANDYYEITGVQLELGSVATPFSRAGGTIQGELAACQRYYQPIVSGSNKVVAAGRFYSSTSASVFLPFLVTMRTTPSLISTSGTSYWDFQSGGDYLSTAVFINAQSPRSCTIQSDSLSGATAGQGCLLYSNNASASLALEAEL